MNLIGRLLIGTSLCAVLSSMACNKLTANDPEEVGEARFAIANVPPNVQCLRINAATGGATNRQLFDVMPGASSVLTMSGLPAGPVVFSGDATPTTCAGITPSTQATWAATPVAATIAAGASVDVTLVMVPAGGANVTVDFRDAGAPGGSGGAGGAAGGGGAGGTGGTGGTGGMACVDPPFAPLALINGWTAAPFSTTAPAIMLDCAGIVHFKGAIAAPVGAVLAPFCIPAGMVPPTNLFVPVDMVSAAKGRLNITSTGSVTLQAFTAIAAEATAFTSLEGASYALSATGFTPLTLGVGWINAPFTTRNAAISVSNGIVYLQGAIASTGTNLTNSFTIPVGFRPSTTVYVTADMFGAAPGRLQITPAGAVILESIIGPTTPTQFTSLEGVWYPLTAAGSTPLTLNTGWTNAPFMTRNAAAAVSGGIVRLQGAIASGTTAGIFTLPVGMRPATNVWTPVNVCSGKKGRLAIVSTGAVTVEVLPLIGNNGGGTFADATCFVSLEGVSFGL